MIHFLIEEEMDLSGLDGWDPDDEPTRFADAVGHNLLELHRRLLRRGRVTTVGRRIPRDATLVLVMARRMHWRPSSRLVHAWRLRRHRVVLVRSDLPVAFVRRFRADLEVAPNRTFLDVEGHRGRCFLPALTQRGLIGRDPARADEISAVCLKTNPGNIPDRLLDPQMIERFDAEGVTLHIDAPTMTDGSDQRWHDFGDVDVAICARREGLETLTKPATKLRNAWAAGVIPIAAREPAYTEIGTDGVDVLFFDDIDMVPDLLRRLRTDEDLRGRLRRGVAATAAVQPSTDELVDAWWDALVAIEDEPSWRRGVESMAHVLRDEHLVELATDAFRAAASRAIARWRRRDPVRGREASD